MSESNGLSSHDKLLAQGWNWLVDVDAFDADGDIHTLRTKHCDREYCLGDPRALDLKTYVGIYEREHGSKVAVILPFPVPTTQSCVLVAA